jgi:selenide,water dikinase
MQHKARGRWIEDAVKSMIQSNRRAAEALYAHGATACTDVTGFGLLGHLVEMIKPSAVDVEIDLASLPLIDGAQETVAMGILSSLQPANLRLRRAIANMEEAVTSPLYPLIFDPQTSGGLLASLPAQSTDACLRELVKLGYRKAAVVGRVRAQGEQLEPVRLIR